LATYNGHGHGHETFILATHPEEICVLQYSTGALFCLPVVLRHKTPGKTILKAVVNVIPLFEQDFLFGRLSLTFFSARTIFPRNSEQSFYSFMAYTKVLFTMAAAM
jgi:hypothetical protein